MREILQIGVGQFGVASSYSFWSQLAWEHGINPEGRIEKEVGNEKLDVFWDETSSKEYHPRTVQIDLDSQGIDKVLGMEYSSLLSPDNLFYSDKSSNNNWATGHYNEGFTLFDTAFEQMRKIMEKCECFQGCYLNLGLSGGTGSGLGGLVAQRLNELDSKKQIHVNALFPNYNFETNVLAPYNATLGVSHLSQFSNLVYVFDNEQLFKIVDRDMILAKPTYEDTNRLVAQNMTTFSASMRYPNLLNADLRKQAENLIPFPAMIYFPTSLVHIKDTSRMTVKEAINELHNKDNLSAEIDLLTERSMLTTFISACGADIPSGAIERTLEQVILSKDKYYIEWILSNFLVTLSKKNPLGQGQTVAAAFNNTNFKNYLRHTTDRYHHLFRRKAFMYLYTQAGLDEMEIVEANSTLTDLMDSYTEYHGVCEDDESEEFMGESESEQ